MGRTYFETTVRAKTTPAPPQNRTTSTWKINSPSKPHGSTKRIVPARTAAGRTTSPKRREQHRQDGIQSLQRMDRRDVGRGGKEPHPGGTHGSTLCPCPCRKKEQERLLLYSAAATSACLQGRAMKVFQYNMSCAFPCNLIPAPFQVSECVGACVSKAILMILCSQQWLRTKYVLGMTWSV